MNTTERALRLLYSSSSNSQKWGSDGRGPRTMRLVAGVGRGILSPLRQKEEGNNWMRIHPSWEEMWSEKKFEKSRVGDS